MYSYIPNEFLHFLMGFIIHISKLAEIFGERRRKQERKDI